MSSSNGNGKHTNGKPDERLQTLRPFLESAHGLQGAALDAKVFAFLAEWFKGRSLVALMCRTISENASQAALDPRTPQTPHVIKAMMDHDAHYKKIVVERRKEEIKAFLKAKGLAIERRLNGEFALTGNRESATAETIELAREFRKLCS